MKQPWNTWCPCSTTNSEGWRSNSFAANGLPEFLSRVSSLRLLLEHDADLLARHRVESAALEAARVRYGQSAERLAVAESELAARQQEIAAERAQRAREYQRETERAFSFGGRSIAREERLEAGFTEEEVDEIAELAASRGGAPRRETLVAAAEQLRDRHLARLRGEEVPPLS